jgi:LysR family glycine cleavage system transcriptional activator
MSRPPRLPLQTLAAFRAAARLQNLRAAAEELSLTHGAVSQQIRLMEEQLGFAVFQRHGRRIALNPAGEALWQGVERAWTALDEAVHAAAAASGSGGLRLRITTLPSFAQHWLMPRIARWRERHPDIGLELEASQRLIDLQRDGFHAAVRQGRGPWPGLHNELLAESPFIAVPVRHRRRWPRSRCWAMPTSGHSGSRPMASSAACCRWRPSTTPD